MPMRACMSISRFLAAVAIFVCAVLASGMTAPEGSPPRITVMTWNMYFGGGNWQGTPGMAELFESARSTNIHARATRMARIIDQSKPHIISLQEVALWRTKDILGEQRDDIDFLPILLTRLLNRGLNYQVVGVLETIDFEAPGEIDGDFRMIRWQERIVMLARVSTHLQVNNVRHRQYNSTFAIDIPVVGPLRFNRGWIAADITFRDRKARYVCTHLESLDPVVRRQQAQHLINWLSNTGLPVVVMGDLNALPMSNEYNRFTNAGYTDAWSQNHGLFSGPTCCQSSDLQNAQSTLAARIDYVLTRGAITPTAASRVGHRQVDRTPAPPQLWPSDHAGVVARVRLD